MKLCLDEDLSPAIAERLRRHRIDAVSAHEVRMSGRPDAEQLAFATREDRCLVTRNVRHFRELAETALRRQAPHAGIALCPPSLPGDEMGVIVARLRRVVERYPHGLGEYGVVYL